MSVAKNTNKRNKKKSRLIAYGYGNWQGINGYKGEFGLFLVLFKLDVSFCFKYIMTSDTVIVGFNFHILFC